MAVSYARGTPENRRGGLVSYERGTPVTQVTMLDGSKQSFTLDQLREDFPRHEVPPAERILIERMTSDRKVKVSREGSK